MVWVWEHADVAGTDLIALLALADWSDETGENWHSVASLAKRCRRTERATRATLRRLEQAGYLVTVTRRGKSSVYRLQIPQRLRAEVGFRGEVTGPTPEVTGPTPEVATSAEPSIEPSLNPNAPQDSVPRSRDGEEKNHEPITKESQLHLSAQGQRRVEKAKGKRVKPPVVGEGTVLPPRAKKPDYYDLAEKAERMARGEK